MICKLCRDAAAVAVEPRVIIQFLYGRPQETVPGRVAARKWHAACPGGTWCDCQHVLPATTRTAVAVD